MSSSSPSKRNGDRHLYRRPFGARKIFHRAACANFPCNGARDIGIGRAAFDSDSAGRLAAAGDPVILVRPDISTADVAGFAVSTGILTAAGGRTARAALVARQMG